MKANCTFRQIKQLGLNRHDLMIQRAHARDIHHNTLTLFHQHWPKNVSSRTLDMHTGIIKEKNRTRIKQQQTEGCGFNSVTYPRNPPSAGQLSQRRRKLAGLRGRRWREGGCGGEEVELSCCWIFFPVISSALHHFFQEDKPPLRVALFASANARQGELNENEHIPILAA